MNAAAPLRGETLFLSRLGRWWGLGLIALATLPLLAGLFELSITVILVQAQATNTFPWMFVQPEWGRIVVFEAAMLLIAGVLLVVGWHLVARKPRIILGAEEIQYLVGKRIYWGGELHRHCRNQTFARR